MPIEPNATNVEHRSLLERAAPRSLRLWDREPGTGNPLITICIPTRNRATLVGDAVKRVLAQSYSNIEVLVSDNASTDDTLATLRSITDSKAADFDKFPQISAIMQTAWNAFVRPKANIC